MPLWFGGKISLLYSLYLVLSIWQGLSISCYHIEYSEISCCMYSFRNKIFREVRNHGNSSNWEVPRHIDEGDILLCFMFHSRQDFSQARNDGNRHLLFYVLLTTEILPIRIELGEEDITTSTTREGTSEESGISSSEVSRDQDIARRVGGSGVGSIKTRSS